LWSEEADLPISMTFEMIVHSDGKGIAHSEEERDGLTEHRAMISNERAGDSAEVDMTLHIGKFLGLACFVASLLVRSIRV